MTARNLTLALLATVATSFAGAAFAADAYTPPADPSYAPPPAEWSWTGAYFGGHSGYGWGTPKDGADCEGENFWVAVMEPGEAADLGACLFGDVLAAGSLDNSLTDGIEYYEVEGFKGYLGGVQVGYNRQIGNFILGAEVNGSLSALTSGRVGDSIGGEFTGDYDINWILTATSKVGFAMGKLMVFGEGGLALLGTSVSNSLGVSDETTASGWTAGVGGSFMLTDSISVFAKYNYIKADGVEHTGTSYAIFPTYFRSDIELNLVTVGFNKHL